MDITAQELLALLPLATAATLASRLVIGWRSIGTFAPALLALMLMQLGPRDAAAAFLVAVGAALLAAPMLDLFPVGRSTRLSVLVVVVVGALVGSGTVAAASSAAPVVVLAIVMERTWDAANVGGARDAARLFLGTAVVANAIAMLLGAVAEPLLSMAWWQATAFGIAVNLIVGSYRGLRITELRRFRPIAVQGAAAVEGTR